MTLLDNLYVSQTAAPHQQGHQNQALSEPRPWSDPTIYGLGILLLELALGCPLEVIPADPSDLGGKGTSDALTEYRKAFRLAATIEKKDGTFLAIAIMKCLRCNAASLDSQFHESFYEDVVAPLEKCLELIP
jgi:hypothetical protein